MPRNEQVVRRVWNGPQSVFLQSDVGYIDYEGGVRSGKTTALVWKLINAAVDHPGIMLFLARWTQDALDMQVKPKFYEECPKGLLGKWNAKEEYQEFTNKSLLYLRSLKTSDDAARYSKFSGLTLAKIGIDQPEELPEDVFTALKARLSQVGYPHQLLLTPNPPAPNHWLAVEFPETGDLPNHQYLCTSVYDNRKVLGEEYIASLEQEYPVGHVLRRRFIEGKRGFSIEGQPVYGAVFSRGLHVRDVVFDPRYALLESWDFGQKHPAVLWSQFLPGGWWNVLGEYLGTRQFLDEAVPAVAALRTELFPGLTQIRVCCDPAGADKQGHGIRQTAVDVLNSHLRARYGPQVGAVFTIGSNAPSKREFCIQSISGMLTRLIKGRPALCVHPQCAVFLDGLEAGYVYDDRIFSIGQLSNLRRPRKDGYYDHLQNAAEYTWLNFGSMSLSSGMERMSEKERLRAAQMDYDPDDRRRSPMRGFRAR